MRSNTTYRMWKQNVHWLKNYRTLKYSHKTQDPLQSIFLTRIHTIPSPHCSWQHYWELLFLQLHGRKNTYLRAVGRAWVLGRVSIDCERCVVCTAFIGERLRRRGAKETWNLWADWKKIIMNEIWVKKKIEIWKSVIWNHIMCKIYLVTWSIIWLKSRFEESMIF